MLKTSLLPTKLLALCSTLSMLYGLSYYNIFVPHQILCQLKFVKRKCLAFIGFHQRRDNERFRLKATMTEALISSIKISEIPTQSDIASMNIERITYSILSWYLETTNGNVKCTILQNFRESIIFQFD
jgi:hypothetical protein